MVTAVFKSCWNDCIYELSAHERHHQFVIISRKLGRNKLFLIRSCDAFVFFLCNVN